MKKQFEQSHEKLLSDVINQVKGDMLISKERVETIKGIVKT